jgi:ribose transport system substrate-binding protein
MRPNVARCRAASEPAYADIPEEIVVKSKNQEDQAPSGSCVRTTTFRRAASRGRARSSARRAVLFGFTALLCGLFAAGCKKGDNASAGANGSAQADAAPKQVKLAFVTNNAAEFWKIAAAGIRQYERESKVQVDIKMPANGTTEEQNQILENLASQGYDAIAVSAIAPDDQVPVFDRVAAKSKLITFDSDAPKSKRLLYIGTNNYQAGKTLGGEIIKLLPGGGKMAVFVGTLAADNAAQRLKGIEDAIAGHGIEIVEKREDNVDRAKARSNVEDILNARTDLKLVAGLYSYNGPAIAAALEALGKKGKVSAAVFDEEEGSLDGIANELISCSVVQKPFQFGYLSSKWMHELATDPAATARIPADKTIDTGVEIIDKKNIVEFRAKLAEMKKQ